MKTVTAEQARELAEEYPMERFLGSAHELPPEGADDAFIYVTDSKDANLIGMEVRVDVEERRSSLHAIAMGTAGDSVVRGPASISGATLHQHAVFPLDEGWGWGRVLSVEKEGTYVMVHGGVGIRVPLTEHGGPSTFRTKVPRAYQAPSGVKLPPLGATKEDLQRLDTENRLINTERKIQDDLYRAMTHHLESDSIDEEEMPEFKFTPTWWVETNIDLVHLGKVIDGHIPTDITDICSGGKPLSRESVTFKRDFPAKRSCSRTSQTAIRDVQAWAKSYAVFGAPAPSYVTRIYSSSPIYGGIR